jgi:hypothetical protein
MTRRTDGPFFIYEILPGQLYQRGKLAGLSVAVKRAGLAYYGITHAISLAPPRPDLDLIDWSERDSGPSYTHKPIPDGLFKTADDLLFLGRWYAHWIELGGATLTMCNAGRNRSGLLSALIVRELTGLPGAAAMAVVRHHRPNAIANPNFERFLEALS